MLRFILLAAIAAPALAQPAANAPLPMVPTGPGLPPGYLAGQPPVDILTLLPPPPAPGSAQDAADRMVYKESRKGVGKAAWNNAIVQLNPTSPQFLAALSCAAGATISRESTPATYAMLARAGIDFAAPMTRAKDFYKRPRPFTTDRGKACDPIAADGKGEKLGWAYPSGHSGIGWLWALILSDARPAQAGPIRAFGQGTGDLRLACRVHWLSDVAYGRVLGAAVYQRVAASPEYQADVKRAAAELTAAPAPTGCGG